MKKISAMNWEEQQCVHGLKAADCLTPAKIKAALKNLSGWKYANGKIYKAVQFESFYQAVAFVNAVAWIAQKNNHHPDILLEFKNCRLSYWTHSAAGVTINDLICAAQIDKL